MFSKKRGLGRNKSGELHEIYFILFNYLLLLFCGLILFAYIGLVAKDTLFFKLYVSRDVALMVSTIFAAPGNIYAVYTARTDDFRVKIDEFQVDVYEDTSKIGTRYIFSTDYNMTFTEGESDKTSVEFSKVSNNVTAGSNFNANIKRLKCPSISTYASIKTKNVIIDPARNKSNPGAINSKNKAFKEDTQILMIASTLDSTGASFGSKTLTRTAGDDKSTAERLAKINANTDIVISLRAGNYSDDRNVIKAYIPKGTNKEKSEKLACYILNSISDEFSESHPVQGLSIVPSEDAIISKNINGVALILELGNMQVDSLKNMLNQPKQISKAIYSGINSYYSK